MSPDAMAELVARIKQLAPHEVPGVVAVVVAQALVMPPAPLPLAPSPEPEAKPEYLTLDEAASLLRYSRRYLQRNWQRFPFAVKVGPKRILLEKSGLTRWAARQKRP